MVGGTALLVGLTTALAVRNASRSEPANSIVRFAISIPAADCDPRDWFCQLQDVIALSPDGKNLIYVSTLEGVRQLYRRSIDQLQVLAIPGTEGVQQPFFSPDGVWIGFFADGQLKKVRAAGGVPETICDVTSPFGASWTANGMFVFGISNLGLMHVRASGGVAEPLTTVDSDRGEYGHGWPQVLPGTSAVLFNILTEGDNPNKSRIVVFSPETGERKSLIDGGSNPRYVSTGHIIYIVEGSLRAVAFDLEHVEVTGDPVTVLDDAYMEYESLRGGFFDVTETGTLAYFAGPTRPREFMDNIVVWVDRDGREEIIDPELHADNAVRISPDGTKLALSAQNDLWIWDLARRTRSRLTLDRMENTNPLWTLDGTRLVFRSTRDGYGLYWTAADGTGDVERLTRSRAPQIAQDWTPDGTQLFVYDRDDPAEKASTFILTLDPERAYRPLLKTRFYETGANLSPDGNWLAYSSNESGGNEIYVRPFPDVDSGKSQVSITGGTVPVWSSDGSELFYWNRNEFMRVATDISATFTAGVPEVMFTGPYFYGYSTPSYDIAADASRFLMLKPIENESRTAPQINVVINWFEELKTGVPTDH